MSYSYNLQRIANAKVPKPSQDGVRTALNDKLIPYLNTGSEKDLQNDDVPDVFIAFDEAHTLTGPKDDLSKRSHFHELRWALHEVKEAPCFSFFLSTVGKISEFATPKDADLSMRISKMGFIPSLPFSDLGFDHLMHDRKIFDKYKTIDDVTSIDCVVHLGRPL